MPVLPSVDEAVAPILDVEDWLSAVACSAVALASTCWQLSKWDSVHNPLRPKASWVQTSRGSMPNVPQEGAGVCRFCDGRARVECLECNSKGRINHTDKWLLGPGVNPQWCPFCGGSGLAPCPACGMAKSKRTRMGIYKPGTILSTMPRGVSVPSQPSSLIAAAEDMSAGNSNDHSVVTGGDVAFAEQHLDKEQ